MSPHRRLLLASLAAVTACARPPSLPPPGSATLWGYVRPVARPGVTAGQKAHDSYADRRLRGVSFVDYQRPGFAVVYLEGEPAPGGSSRVTIEGSLLGPRLAPPYVAIGAGGKLVLRNADVLPHTVSCPAAEFVRRLGPGEEAEVASYPGGGSSLFLLDSPRTEAVVFVAPGPYAVVSYEGRWELHGVSPGRRTIHAWHPRLPAASREIEVPSGATMRVDLDVGVGNLDADVQPR